jgi:hypothetical protein
MRAATGIAAHLGPLLCERGFARPASWSTQSWRERASAAFAAVKRASPPRLKRVYYRSVAPGTARRLARSTMLPPYVWPETRAFALPSDQHGWVRINLQGREAQGSVPPGDFEATLSEVEAFCQSLEDETGRPLVGRVIRTVDGTREAASSLLPDLVVHWTDAALASPLRVKGSQLTFSPIGQKFTGQHALDGFCLSRGTDLLLAGDTVKASDLGGIIAAAATKAPSRQAHATG